MSDVIVATAPVVPVMADGSVRAEQVTQLVLSELAELLETRGEWVRIRAESDGYEGWVNAGYARALGRDEAAGWRRDATAWSEGAAVSVGQDLVRLPLRARVAIDGGLVTLPDGRAGRVIEGRVVPAGELAADAARTPAHRWALDRFRGSPYQWGGVTPWGVDCSGLVQTTFQVRGIPLPRDSSRQALAGEPVALDAVAPGDLLFFHGESGPRITHVAFAAENDSLIHSTIARGGVVHESFAPGSRAGELLRPRLAAARRIPEGGSGR